MIARCAFWLPEYERTGRSCLELKVLGVACAKCAMCAAYSRREQRARRLRLAANAADDLLVRMLAGGN